MGRLGAAAFAATAVLGVLSSGPADAGIRGYTSATNTFSLEARAGFITVADGAVIPIWGYGVPTSTPGAPMYGMQYPGPTLIVNQGADVTINLSNCLGDQVAGPNVSFMISGIAVETDGGVPGELTAEAEHTGSAACGTPVEYSFTADRAGTFMYQSGTDTVLQTQMGLFGTLIVRPTGFEHRPAADRPDPMTDDPYAFESTITGQTAYGEGTGTDYDYEHLYVLSEIDPEIHDLVAAGDLEAARAHEYWPVYWFINGRAGPDTLFGDLNDGVFWLPTQPYSALTPTLPGQKILMRVVGAGHDIHPFHTHGDNHRIIAVDGHMTTLDDESTRPNAGWSDYTMSSKPGQTLDAIFDWSDAGMGWDIYADPNHPIEWHHRDWRGETDDHGNNHVNIGKIPVDLPPAPDTTFGGFYSGSPFIGDFGELPPGEGGLNAAGGMFFMWHSHSEKELVNNDVFPGGMLTMLVVLPFVGPDGIALEIPRGADTFETELP